MDLATDVFRLLTERVTTFTSLHYELLVTTYLNANDLSAALSIILIMFDTQKKLDSASCQTLYQYLADTKHSNDDRPIKAFTMLQDFEASKRKVPTAAVNACILASIDTDRFAEAIEMYKALHSVAHAGPNTDTFNILFKGCRNASRKELALFFANEMITLGLKPNSLTYDRLIWVCLERGDLDDALRYFEEMRASAMNPRRRTWETLIVRCCAKGDVKAVALLKEYKERVEEPRKYVEKAVVDRFEFGIEPVVEGQFVVHEKAGAA